jgi:hypothetical protein
MSRWRIPRWQDLRDPLIVLTGLALSIHEAVFTKVIRPELLILFAGMIGAPVFARKDEKRNKEKDSGEPDSESGQ